MRNIQPGVFKQKGVAAIELTIIAPFMFLLLFACAEFGRMMYQYNALTNIVRDASRYLSDKVMTGTKTIALTDELKADTTNLIIAGAISGDNEMLPGLASASISYQVTGAFVTITVIYDWTPIFSDELFTISRDSAISLNFPMEVTYTMRAS